MLRSLKKAVSDALDRKRRLGQYAVIWKDGKIAFIGADRVLDDIPPSDHLGAVGEDKTEYPKQS